MQRNEETLEATTYANRLPDDLSGRQVFLPDPMLATGGSLVMAIEYLAGLGARDITAVTLLSAPEGIAHVRTEAETSSTSRSPWSPELSTSGSTSTATSFPGSGMPETGSTAASEPPGQPARMTATSATGRRLSGSTRPRRLTRHMSTIRHTRSQRCAPGAPMKPVWRT